MGNLINIHTYTPSCKAYQFIVGRALPLPGLGGSASTIAFATWHRRFGPVINRLRSASFGFSLVLSLFLRFGADLRGVRTFAYARL